MALDARTGARAAAIVVHIVLSALLLAPLQTAAATPSPSCAGVANLEPCLYSPCSEGVCFDEACLQTDNLPAGTECFVGGQQGNCTSNAVCANLQNTTAPPTTTTTTVATTTAPSNATVTAPAPTGCVGRPNGNSCTPPSSPCSNGACFEEVCYIGNPKADNTPCVSLTSGLVGSCSQGQCISPNTTTSTTPGLTTTTTPAPGYIDCTDPTAVNGDTCQATSCRPGKCSNQVCFQSPTPHPEGTECALASGGTGECKAGVCTAFKPTTTATTSTTTATTATTTTTTTTATTTTTTTPLPTSCAGMPDFHQCRATPCVVGTCLNSVCLQPVNPPNNNGEPCVDLGRAVFDGVCDSSNVCQQKTTQGNTLTTTPQPETTTPPTSDCTGQPTGTACDAGACVVNAVCSQGACFFERQADDGEACTASGGAAGLCRQGACVPHNTTTTATTTTTTTTATTTPATTTSATTTTSPVAEPPQDQAVVSFRVELDNIDSTVLTNAARRALIAVAVEDALFAKGVRFVTPRVVVAFVSRIDPVPGRRRRYNERVRRADDVEAHIRIYILGNIIEAIAADKAMQNAITDGTLLARLRVLGLAVDGVQLDEPSTGYTLNSQTGNNTPAPTTTTTTAAPSTSDSDSDVVLVAIILGCILAVIALAFVSWYCNARNRRRKELYSMAKVAPLPPPTERRVPKEAPKPAPQAQNVDNFVEARKPENAYKNRYRDVLPYDRTRVRLSGTDSGEDYINANWVPGYDAADPMYICAQGPLKHTVSDFWHMICQHHVNIVVMVARHIEAGREKVYQYWPNSIDEPLVAGGFTVSLVQEEQYTNYVYRELAVRHVKNGKAKHVIHLQFLGWPDHGVPKSTDTLNEFRDKLAQVRRATPPGPLLVHCSAGVGRTGCFIGFDRELQRFCNEGNIDVFDCVVQMRQARPYMVQTASQYVFCHQLLLDEIVRLEEQTDAPVPGMSRDKAEFLKQFSTVQTRYKGFELAINGREILHLGHVGLRSAKPEHNLPKSSTCSLVICNDVVLLTQMVGGKQQLISKPTQRPKVVVQDAQREWDEPLFQVKLGSGTYVLEATDEVEKESWLQRLSVGNDYVPTKHLRGPRLVPGEAFQRADIARLLDIPDPYTTAGAEALAREWETIPKTYTANVKILPTVSKREVEAEATQGVGAGGSNSNEEASELIVQSHESYLVSEDGYQLVDRRPQAAQQPSPRAKGKGKGFFGSLGRSKKNRRSWYQFSVSEEPLEQVQAMMMNDPAERERVQLEELERKMTEELREKEQRAMQLAQMAQQADALALQAGQIVEMAERPLQQQDQPIVLNPLAYQEESFEEDDMDNEQLRQQVQRAVQQTRRATLSQVPATQSFQVKQKKKPQTQQPQQQQQQQQPQTASTHAPPANQSQAPEPSGSHIPRRKIFSLTAIKDDAGGPPRPQPQAAKPLYKFQQRQQQQQQQQMQQQPQQQQQQQSQQRQWQPPQAVQQSQLQQLRQQQAAPQPQQMQKRASFTLTRAAMSKLNQISDTEEEPDEVEQAPIQCTYLGNCKCPSCEAERA